MELFGCPPKKGTDSETIYYVVFLATPQSRLDLGGRPSLVKITSGRLVYIEVYSAYCNILYGVRRRAALGSWRVDLFRVARSISLAMMNSEFGSLSNLSNHRLLLLLLSTAGTRWHMGLCPQLIDNLAIAEPWRSSAGPLTSRLQLGVITNC